MAVEHTMFMFDDLKVTSHDDRKTEKQNEKHKVRNHATILMVMLPAL